MKKRFKLRRTGLHGLKSLEICNMADALRTDVAEGESVRKLIFCFILSQRTYAIRNLS